jgi:hypothetical protein
MTFYGSQSTRKHDDEFYMVEDRGHVPNFINAQFPA